jgi:hypothetical protein
MITWLFISFIMQGRKEIPTMNAKAAKITAWLVIYAGSIFSFYLYYSEKIVVASLVLVGSIVIGSAAVSFLNKRKHVHLEDGGEI